MEPTKAYKVVESFELDGATHEVDAVINLTDGQAAELGEKVVLVDENDRGAADPAASTPADPAPSTEGAETPAADPAPETSATPETPAAETPVAPEGETPAGETPAETPSAEAQPAGWAGGHTVGRE